MDDFDLYGVSLQFKGETMYPLHPTTSREMLSAQSRRLMSWLYATYAHKRIS